MERNIITKEQVQDAIDAAYTKFVGVTEGRNADYIPYLKGIDSNLFGISVCLANGECISAGETTFAFGIESISKVGTALLAMEQHGAAEVLDKIGADATGLPFNSIMAILLENDHPSTPLVNAGAICACSMINPKGDPDAKWRAITSFFASLAGSELKLIGELYKSESESNFNNKSIAWLLKNFDRIYDDPDMSLDIYTRQCSLGVTSDQLAIMAATIANSGTNPVTREEVFKPNLTTHITSMMATVGLYENTGDWMFSTGVPAKSGVGGAIMGVIPGVMGIAAFAPPLDIAGNSVKAQRAISYIANRLGLNVYSQHRCSIEEQEPVPAYFI